MTGYQIITSVSWKYGIVKAVCVRQLDAAKCWECLVSVWKEGACGRRSFLLFYEWRQVSRMEFYEWRVTMDFAYSEKVNELRKRVNDFMDRYIYPNEQTYRDQIAASG